MTFGQQIRWTGFNGDEAAVSVSGRSTPSEALRDALELAKNDGWTNPKWWQWWRYGDTSITEIEIPESEYR